MSTWQRLRDNLYEVPVLPRTLVLWSLFMVLLWTVFTAGWITHLEAWVNVPPVEREAGWPVFWYILRNNFLIVGMISAGNVFVRFGRFTPGLLILGMQALVIGWTAGTNGFVDPFPSIAAANEAFLRIGLWETTAYVLICSATFNESMLVADTFPAVKWTKVTPWNEIRLTFAEIVVSLLAILSLLGAAYGEAFLPI
ncbi:MAG TPA: hypothetical protein VK888_05680 [Anaerolineales bacterium]|nr:hypothetical protein [Anaerolineales bacterium]